MNVLLEIKTKLDALGTLGVHGIGFMPASPNVQGIIQPYGGDRPERRFGVVGVGYENPAIQLLYRGDPYDFNGPFTKAGIALQYLMSIPPGALGNGITTVYLQIDPQQSPHPVAPIDANFRHSIGVNFYIRKEPS